MNIYTQESFQKYERNRSSKRPKYNEWEEKSYKGKACYSKERNLKRSWREE